ncbi:hypothetical protein SKAU_G00404110 [Synaphobranchus kaupii]|uniref:Uncharacterized protein n=1 Tax=Synaphobranchus kaupii TaxID=118154 RepID=A0A9Q1ICP1_SYNKA|nr:hypothetical protein SKAU_G00404110 [Synaphobranchus kaupii]
MQRPQAAVTPTPFLSKLIVSTPTDRWGPAHNPHCHSTSGGERGREEESSACPGRGKIPEPQQRIILYSPRGLGSAARLDWRLCTGTEAARGPGAPAVRIPAGPGPVAVWPLKTSSD